jgi:hypothetical protein
MTAHLVNSRSNLGTCRGGALLGMEDRASDREDLIGHLSAATRGSLPCPRRAATVRPAHTQSDLCRHLASEERATSPDARL